MDSLNNTIVGGPSADRVSYRFRATASSPLSSARVYVIGPTHDGYGAGTGGTWQVTIQTDDGTAAHEPGSTVLASATLTPTDGFPLVAFASPPAMEAGQLYHIVFRNTDAEPAANYASLDGVFMYQPTSPRQPRAADTDWGQAVSQGNGAWADTADTVPILQLAYANGDLQGLGYMEAWVRSPRDVTGASSVREAFTVSGVDRAVSSFSVRLMRLSGDSPLAVRLETDAGDLVAQCQIPAAAVPVGVPGDHDGPGHAAWAGCTFAAPLVLAQGQAYHAVLSAPQDTTYSVFAVRKGLEYGFGAATYFADGRGQVTAGSGWGPFTQDGGGPLDEGDLQFYFR